MTPATLRAFAEFFLWQALLNRMHGAFHAARECTREADRYTAAAEKMEEAGEP